MRRRAIRVWIGVGLAGLAALGAGAGVGAGVGAVSAIARAADANPPAPALVPAAAPQPTTEQHAAVAVPLPVAPPPALPPVLAVPMPQAPVAAPAALPAWQRNAVAAPARDGRPRIAVVIDDVGVHVPNAQRTLNLPGPLTLSLMTYAINLPKLAEEAHARGHEVMLHVPMEPEEGADPVDPGPNVLDAGLAPAELHRRMEWALGRADGLGIVGINNHMGSKFTADRPAMTALMQELSARGLLFLDSLTTGHSVGRATARAANVPFVARDVFLDNEETPEAVRQQLKAVEAAARRDGSAVAIGHPKAVTLDALRAWLPTLAARGFVLVPLTALVPDEAPATLAKAVP